MTDPDFASLEDALLIHTHQIEQYGGSAGVRDLGLLSSAIATPRASFDGRYLHPTLVEQAAAYLFHVAQNHPFVDGNKRAALAIALTFLGLNDVQVEAPDAALIELVLGVATGAVSKAAIAVFLEKHAR
jgi:death-on-curing protein